LNKFPDWLKKRFIATPEYIKTKTILKDLDINTVCQHSLCPNMNECFGRSHATFMILGKACTRGCRFCAVEKGQPEDVDRGEPKRIKEAVFKLSLKHVIITSVTRDDLDDGGAEQFVNTINEIRSIGGDITIEILTPDFKGKKESVEKVTMAKPDIFGHNIETVPSLYKNVCADACYGLSLNLLREVKKADNSMLTKSGIMLGLGEKESEVLEVFKDLIGANCDILTIGQYLKPHKDALEVREFIHPSAFLRLKEEALSYGFKHVESGPFVRSSYYDNKDMLTKLCSRN